MTGQGFGAVRPLPGDGLVAYLGGLLLVCDAAEAAADELLRALRETADAGGDGRALARRAAQVLAANMTGDPANCAVAGPVGGGVAVLVSGSASAMVTTASGETRLAGSDSLTWADRLINGPVQRVALRLPGGGEPHPAVQFDGGVVHGGGLVGDFGDVPERAPAQSRPLTSEMPNTALHFEPELVVPPPVQRAPYPLSGNDQPATPSGPQPSSGPLFNPQPPSGPQPQPVLEQPPFLSAVPDLPPPAEQPSGFPTYDEPAPALSGNGTMPEQYEQPASPYDQPRDAYDQPREQFDQPREHFEPPREHFEPPREHFEQPRELFEQPPPPPPPAQEEHGDRQLVYGVDCKNDHFNDPRVPYCAVCGIALVQRTLVPYKGPRPPLGVLILDDGTALPLESDYLLGRDPERAPEVAGGTARPAKVTSPDGSVSRRHLRVALDGWDVNLVDLGSVNGTQIQPPGDPNFYDIPPNEPVTIVPGTTVRVGVSRTMRFEAHRG
ncbi:FHA domain-containing protein [Nonomuraea sp. NPDC026600]|uniref:FHA domain-containing protein n=1 Tax=Nonomuraea sp. NPDC026600 TaxID=3155363 RepID=UPI0033F4D27F